jgi:hypothetical protein
MVRRAPATFSGVGLRLLKPMSNRGSQDEPAASEIHCPWKTKERLI